MPDLVKLRFLLTREEGGWPPAESEALWAEPLGDDLYRIDNTPWFVFGVSADDVVKAMAGSDGVLWGIEPVRRSGRQTVRIITRSGAPMHRDSAAVVRLFEPLGVRSEVMERPVPMVALDVPADVPLQPVKELLRQGETDGWWDYEEACVTQEWLALQT
jgi:hypothetical protein